MLKTKDGYELELQTPQTVKLVQFFGSTKKNDTTKNEENVQSLKVVDVVLVQCNLLEIQCQKNCEMLYTFTPAR